MSTPKCGKCRNDCNAYTPYNTCTKSVFLRTRASIVEEPPADQTYQNCIHCAKYIHHIYYLSFFCNHIISRSVPFVNTFLKKFFRPPGREMRGCPRTRTQREVYYERRIGEWRGKAKVLNLPRHSLPLAQARFRTIEKSFPWWSIVSHIIPYYFNSWGTGSHLYTANANTLRSVHRNKDLLALVGTHISWSPCPPLLCLNYITNLAICSPRGHLERQAEFHASTQDEA